METHSLFQRRHVAKSRTPAVKWVKQWVPQDLVTTGGKCLVLKWVNGDVLFSKRQSGSGSVVLNELSKRPYALSATFKATEEKSKEPEVVEPEPTTEVLFLCSLEGCGKTFIDAGALRKHSHIHGERQYICHYENCGKKFLDSSKLKRHFLTHTGKKDFVCPHQGCGRAFSLDFNLRSHIKTHSQENYHVCPFPECGKRYAHESKLKNHVTNYHEKIMQNVVEAPKYTPPPPEKPIKTPRASTGPSGPATSDRPYACPYEGCEKAYIHEYKLNLHLRREHPGHFPEENVKNNQPNASNEMGENSDQEVYAGKRGMKAKRQNRPKPNIKLPPPRVPKGKSSGAVNLNMVKKSWPPKEEMYEEEEDSEETEEERETVGVSGGWRYGENNNEEDDEETEYED